ncbi:hypothetical protein FZ054_16085 [Listeria monocytogenes]|nr:hypothetical protein FZ054_16085 [Listeria monocytogenes]
MQLPLFPLLKRRQIIQRNNDRSKRDLPYHIFVDAYKNGSGQTEDNMKHPPLPKQLEDMK